MIQSAFLQTVMFLSTLISVHGPNSSGCGKRPTLANGVQRINDREYILKIPDNYHSNKPHHLIFGLHWGGGNMSSVVNGEGIEPWYGLETRALGSAILVAPDGRDASWANTNGEDVALIDAIIKQVESDLCIDQRSRFVTGFSWGGGMSFSLACSRAKEFRAVFMELVTRFFRLTGGVILANKLVVNNGCQPTNVGRPVFGSHGSVRTDFQRCSKPVSFIAYDGGHDATPLGVGNPPAPDATWKFFMEA